MKRVKYSLFNTLAHRAKVVAHNQQSLQKELDHVRKALQDCHFPTKTLTENMCDHSIKVSMNFSHMLCLQLKQCVNRQLAAYMEVLEQGKPHVLKAHYQGLYHTLEAGQSRDNFKILVNAPTGKAAYK